jgi:hypothetical protein
MNYHLQVTRKADGYRFKITTVTRPTLATLVMEARKVGEVFARLIQEGDFNGYQEGGPIGNRLAKGCSPLIPEITFTHV